MINAANMESPRLAAPRSPFLRLLSLMMCCALVFPGLLQADAATPSPAPARRTITHPSQIFEMSSVERTASYPLHLEGRVSYFDTSWKLFWLERDGLGTYLQLSANAPALRAGQYISIDGTIIPDKGLSADSVTVTIREDAAPVAPIRITHQIDDTSALDSRMVLLDAYVDYQQDIDADHLRLNLIIDGRKVIGWVKPQHYPVLPELQGRFIRVLGLYSRRFDPSLTRAYLELWIGDESQIEVLSSLETTSLFDVPQSGIHELYGMPEGRVVRVRGKVLSQEPGSSVVIRGELGQVLVKTCQFQRLVPGSFVEAVGTLTHDAGHCVLAKGFVRKTTASPAEVLGQSSSGPQSLTIDQLSHLPLDMPSGDPLVSVSGMVTWSLPDRDFFFLQDLSGGIRVRFSRELMSAPPLVKAMRVEGWVRKGEFGPELELRSYRDIGAMNAPPPKPVTLDQAISGREDAQWVSMRGFLQRVVSDNDWRWIHVTTPTGEFVAHLQSPVNFVANPGSLIRIQGVCETSLNDQGKVVGVTLRVPFLHDIAIEEDAPKDPFDSGIRSIRSLSSMVLDNEMRRVRVAGVVTHYREGDYVQIQENDAGVLVLCASDSHVREGDQIEAVGILGTDGLRPVLREAVLRPLGSGKLPLPVPVRDPGDVNTSLDGVLVSVEGTLIDSFHRIERTRLMLQNNTTIFEASLERWPGSAPIVLPGMGSKLRIQGICRVEYDDSRHVRGLSLRLRGPADISVLQTPPALTQERALLIAMLLGAISLFTFGWVYALRRRVKLQTEQIRQQLQHQHRLEAGVQHASRLESLGVMAGGIAHDFNNLLTVIMGNLGLALVNPEGARAVGDHLKDAMKGATRARDLTQQLLTFARGGSPIRLDVSLMDLFNEVLRSVVHGSAISVRFNVEDSLWLANIDRKQMAVALQNIIQNAVQAMAKGGTLTIDVGKVALGESNPSHLKPGRYLHIIITDSGEGMAPEILQRIFDPYFSTKKGSAGLGLATAYSIIKRHEGLVEVSSEQGRGTSFTLHLPASAQVAASAPAHVEPVVTLRPETSARVLIMDDEESIRRIASIVLQRLGLTVSLAADGEEALTLFKEAYGKGTPYDLVILDLTIPGGLGGKDTMAAIRKIDPHVPSIVSSGYSSDPVMADFRSYGFTAMVSKPYELDQLTEAVCQLLVKPTQPPSG